MRIPFSLKRALYSVSVFTSLSLSIPGLAADTLMTAVKSGSTARVKQQLENGLTPNILLPDYSSPLAWAVDQQNRAMVESLLEAGAEPDLAGSEKNNFSPLLLACLRGDAHIVLALIEAGANVHRSTHDDITPFALCAGHSSTSTLDALLQQGANPLALNQQGQSPLMWAAANARTENIEWLLAQEASLNQSTVSGFTPLFFAIKSGRPEPVFLLIEHGADIHATVQDGTTAVQLAMYQHQYAVAAYLVAQGANLKAYDRNGDQLLHAAVKARQPALVSTLLEHGADPNALTGESQVVWRYEVNFTAAPYITYAKSPLLLAAEKGSADIMRILLNAGADPTFKSGDGNSVLHAAAQSKPDTLALAITLAPDINTQNARGQTALHQLLNLGTDKDTTKEDIAQMLTMLASAGARPDLENDSGKTPFSIATRGQHRSKDAFIAAFGNPPQDQL